MNRDYGTNRFRILANQVRNEQEGRHLFEKLTRSPSVSWMWHYNM